MNLPPLDLHAHVNPSISADDLYELGAVVFAVSRSLDEAAVVLARDDEMTIWGVGCHPGVVDAHSDFAASRFDQLLESTAFAGELGLDGKSRVAFEIQLGTLRSALNVLAEKPRIVSLHNYAATEAIVQELARIRSPGRILHWWLGDEDLTRRAVDLGCYFSLPPSAAKRRPDLLEAIPLDRVLTETDHPFGDRRSPGPRPGNVDDVERALGRRHGIEREEVRLKVWHNLGRLTRDVGCGRLLPRRVRTLLAALPAPS